MTPKPPGGSLGAPLNPYHPVESHPLLALMKAGPAVFPDGVADAKRRYRELNQSLVGNGQQAVSAAAMVRPLTELAPPRRAAWRRKRWKANAPSRQRKLPRKN